MSRPLDPRMIGGLCAIKMAYEAEFLTAEHSLALCKTMLQVHGEDGHRLVAITESQDLLDYMLFIDGAAQTINHDVDVQSSVSLDTM